ncbi:Protein S-acyltransferase 17-like [Carpediemonas membranifera]|uniref:Palmitoyltransferase n=1 Tax=Carpediemonas membranifera TaxID=201153 RepID=A0A8J6B6Y9_9EUKA|nr:Protein S-acyltransferase 17-like [Carpediemonas membranifera]|eukprot:KAG9394364.1 Protein S-acyltransferase 17-like [Carpediemonas membranifera]
MGIQRIVPKPVRAVISTIWTLVFKRPNPLVILFYLGLWIGSAVLSYYVFMSPWSAPVHADGKFFRVEQPPFIRPIFEDEPELFGKNLNVLRFSPLYRLVMPVGYLLAGSLFILLVFSDPGFVDRLKPSEKHLLDVPYDNQFYQPQPCVTCQHNKPARSKHCRYCNTCVLRFDHHCIWLNNDVGLFNHGWFLLFLLLHSVGMGAIVVYQCRIFASMLHAFGLPLTFRAIKMLGKYLLTYIPLFAMSALFNATMAVALGLFLLMHLWMMSKNVTTNEMAKRQTVQMDLRARRQTYLLWEQSTAVGQLARLEHETPQPLWKLLPEMYDKPKTAREREAAPRYYKVDKKEAKRTFLYNHYRAGRVSNIVSTLRHTKLRFDPQRTVRRLMSIQNEAYDRAKEVACEQLDKKEE